MTVISMLLYHYTKQKVWELLETTLLAMICSFHMISSRSEHWDREEELEGLIGLEIIANDRKSEKRVQRCATVDRKAFGSKKLDRKMDRRKHDGVDCRQENASTATSVDTVGMLTGKGNTKKHNIIKCSQHFFEHFLDGSAGVMYTSFLGLIIDEFLIWFVDDKKTDSNT